VLSPVILFLGSQRESTPVGLTGLLTGNALENGLPAASGSRDDDQGDQELFERFSHFCTGRATRCAWLRRMQDVHATARYDVSGTALALRGLTALQEEELRQENICGVWYRGLPHVPTFLSEEDQAYAERETAAFWEGYCHHAPTVVLNRPRTAGQRPATWDKFLLRHLVQTVLGLAVPREGLAGPHPCLSPGDMPRVYEPLSTRTPLRADEAAGCKELCAWLEEALPTRPAILTVHLGREVLLARPGAGGATRLLEDSVLPEALATSLAGAARAVADLLGEEFGVSLWEVDVHDRCFLFRDFTPNPPGRDLVALESRLFPLLWQSLTQIRR
jgi:hypothetical protein